jgi:hypothetical protein
MTCRNAETVREVLREIRFKVLSPDVSSIFDDGDIDEAEEILHVLRMNLLSTDQVPDRGACLAARSWSDASLRENPSPGPAPRTT